MAKKQPGTAKIHSNEKHHLQSWVLQHVEYSPSCYNIRETPGSRHNWVSKEDKGTFPWTFFLDSAQHLRNKVDNLFVSSPKFTENSKSPFNNNKKKKPISKIDFFTWIICYIISWILHTGSRSVKRHVSYSHLYEVPCIGRIHFFFIKITKQSSALTFYILHIFMQREINISVVIIASEKSVNFSTTTFIQKCTKLNVRIVLFFNQPPKILYLQFSIVGSISNFSWWVV